MLPIKSLIGDYFSKAIWTLALRELTIFKGGLNILLASLIAQMVKNLPAMQETWVQSLGWEDPMEKGKATHFHTVAWRIPWTV